MAGVALNIAFGNLLLKTVAAGFDGLVFFYLPEKKMRRLDALVGFEYSGISDTTIALEAVQRHILDFDPVLENPPDSASEDVNQYILSYRAELLRQKVDLVAMVVFFGVSGDEGGVRRVSATYDLLEAFSVTGGVVTYQSGNNNPIMEAVKDNDRLFLEARYSF